MIYPPPPPQFPQDELHFRIHEVHYDDDGKPKSYTTEAVCVAGENFEDMKWSIEKMLEALDKPVLWYGPRFPEEYKP
jgi:hypothetical protein